MRADDAAPPQLVEADDERLRVDVARVGQHRRRELAADRRGDARQFAGRRRRAARAAPRSPPAPRAAGASAPACAASTTNSGLPSDAANRRSACGRVERRAGCACAASAAVSARLSRPSAISETAAERLQPGDELAQRVAGVELLAARGRGDQQRRRRRRRAAGSAGTAASGTSHHCRSSATSSSGVPGASSARATAREQALALLALGQRLGAGRGPAARRAARAAGAASSVRARVEPPQPRRDRVRAQPGDDRAVGDGALRRRTTRASAVSAPPWAHDDAAPRPAGSCRSPARR